MRTPFPARRTRRVSTLYTIAMMPPSGARCARPTSLCTYLRGRFILGTSPKRLSRKSGPYESDAPRCVRLLCLPGWWRSERRANVFHTTPAAATLRPAPNPFRPTGSLRPGERGRSTHPRRGLLGVGEGVSLLGGGAPPSSTGRATYQELGRATPTTCGGWRPRGTRLPQQGRDGPGDASAGLQSRGSRQVGARGVVTTAARTLSGRGWKYAVTYPTKYKRLRAAIPHSDRRGSHAPIRISEGLMSGILTVALESAKAATSDRSWRLWARTQPGRPRR